MQIISELVNTCRSYDFTDIIIVHEHRGEPDGLVVCHLPYGPTAFFGVYNTVSLRPSLVYALLWFSESHHRIYFAVLDRCLSHGSAAC